MSADYSTEKVEFCQKKGDYLADFWFAQFGTNEYARVSPMNWC